MRKNYLAHCETLGETEYFETFEEAQKWLEKAWSEEADQGEGIAGETIDGMDYIAKITHRSGFKETDNRKNYCQIECGDCEKEKCDGEEWPYSSAFDTVGVPVLVEVEP